MRLVDQLSIKFSDKKEKNKNEKQPDEIRKIHERISHRGIKETQFYL